MATQFLFQSGAAVMAVAAVTYPHGFSGVIFVSRQSVDVCTAVVIKGPLALC